MVGDGLAGEQGPRVDTERGDCGIDRQGFTAVDVAKLRTESAPTVFAGSAAVTQDPIHDKRDDMWPGIHDGREMMTLVGADNTGINRPVVLGVPILQHDFNGAEFIDDQGKVLLR